MGLTNTKIFKGMQASGVETATINDNGILCWTKAGQTRNIIIIIKWMWNSSHRHQPEINWPRASQCRETFRGNSLLFVQQNRTRHISSECSSGDINRPHLSPLESSPHTFFIIRHFARRDRCGNVPSKWAIILSIVDFGNDTICCYGCDDITPICSIWATVNGLSRIPRRNIFAHRYRFASNVYMALKLITRPDEVNEPTWWARTWAFRAPEIRMGSCAGTLYIFFDWDERYVSTFLTG